MQQNLGSVDRVLRFLLAFWWLGPWSLVYPYTWINWVLFVVGWIALIESFIGFCWLHQVLGIKRKD